MLVTYLLLSLSADYRCGQVTNPSRSCMNLSQDWLYFKSVAKRLTTLMHAFVYDSMYVMRDVNAYFPWYSGLMCSLWQDLNKSRHYIRPMLLYYDKILFYMVMVYPVRNGRETLDHWDIYVWSGRLNILDSSTKHSTGCQCCIQLPAHQSRQGTQSMVVTRIGRDFGGVSAWR